MGVITVQVGQAGNQVGYEFFESMYSNLKRSQVVTPFGGRTEIHRSDSNRFDSIGGFEHHFDLSQEGQCIARAVMIDMESKVVSGIQHKLGQPSARRWNYRRGQSFTESSGAGNNWALGYASAQTDKATQSIDEMVRMEAERCDRLDGFVVPMSVAGGTGSGVGTRVTEQLRDNYPNSYIMNHIIWPYDTGEVMVQNYNAVLSLGRLEKCSDALLFLENDRLHDVCQKLCGPKQKISFQHINKEIARNVVGFMAPCVSLGVGDASIPIPSRFPTQATIADIGAVLCPHSGFKLVTVRTVPQMSDTHREFATYQWEGMVRTLRQMSVVNSFSVEGMNWRSRPHSLQSVGEHNTAISNLMFARGQALQDISITPFLDKELYASWSLHPFTLWQSKTMNSQHEKSVTMLSNSRAVWKPLDRVVSRAWKTFASRAFLHQYEAHNIREDDFVDSFVTCEQIVKNYKDLR
eukprot:m.49602 g.49602  ORF g.49602 m.49602 type:complete len:464 (-) comp21062_c0_seq2:124-1515(-)